MIEEIKVGQKEVFFARHNGRLIYPKYASSENLVLHYDFSGRTNLDVQKGIAEDLSGNGNNGELRGFAYTNKSGYLDNALIFDGINDFITIPESQIDLNNFTYSEGINVLSFRGDNVATVVDGVVEIGGRNLILNSKTWDGKALGTARGVTLSREIVDGESVVLVNYDGVTANPYLRFSGIVKDLGWHTYSVEAKIISGAGSLLLQINDRGDDIHTLTEEWVRYSLTHDNDIITGAFNFVNMYPVLGTGAYSFYLRLPQLGKGNVPIPWTPAPEDLKTTTFKPFFDKKIKSALYWSRALTDEELLQVYNIQIKRT